MTDPSPRPPVTAKAVKRIASRHAVWALGDRLRVGEPAYLEQDRRWSVPVVSSSTQVVVVGQIILDAQGAVLESPSRREVQRAIQGLRKDLLESSLQELKQLRAENEGLRSRLRQLEGGGK